MTYYLTEKEFISRKKERRERIQDLRDKNYHKLAETYEKEYCLFLRNVKIIYSKEIENNSHFENMLELRNKFLFDELPIGCITPNGIIVSKTETSIFLENPIKSNKYQEVSIQNFNLIF